MTTRTHTHVCQCAHGRLSHRYDLASRGNDGACLMCRCAGFENDDEES